jgi:chromosome segregation ATPase
MAVTLESLHSELSSIRSILDGLKTQVDILSQLSPQLRNLEGKMEEFKASVDFVSEKCDNFAQQTARLEATMADTTRKQGNILSSIGKNSLSIVDTEECLSNLEQAQLASSVDISGLYYENKELHGKSYINYK